MGHGIASSHEPDRVTLEDYLRLPETNRPSEVVHGVLEVSAMATPRHQYVAGRLLVALTAACPAEYVVLAPVEWLLRAHPLLLRQPDLAVVPRRVVENDEPRLTQPPLLAVEIVSSESAHRDRYTKRFEYAEAGLGDYWVVDPARPSITAYRLEPGQRAGASRATAGQGSEAREAIGGEIFEVVMPFPFRICPADLIPA